MGKAWHRSARPAARGKWQSDVVEFVASGDDCWMSDYRTCEDARHAGRSLRRAAHELYLRGTIERVSVCVRGQQVYMMMSDED